MSRDCWTVGQSRDFTSFKYLFSGHKYIFYIENLILIKAISRIFYLISSRLQHRESVSKASTVTTVRPWNTIKEEECLIVWAILLAHLREGQLVLYPRTKACS